MATRIAARESSGLEHGASHQRRSASRSGDVFCYQTRPCFLAHGERRVDRHIDRSACCGKQDQSREGTPRGQARMREAGHGSADDVTGRVSAYPSVVARDVCERTDRCQCLRPAGTTNRSGSRGTSSGDPVRLKGGGSIYLSLISLSTGGVRPCPELPSRSLLKTPQLHRPGRPC